MKNRIVLILSLPLTALLIIVSYIGLFTPDFYSVETLNWQAQSLGQDMFDLFFIAPCLIVTSVLAYRNNRIAFIIWGGVVLYLTYTFVLYCFDVHFNKLFVPYCLCLGLSFYALIYFLFTAYKGNAGKFENKFINRLIGFYFIFIALMFYMLWLSEIIPATIHKTIPKSVSDAGLFTNGVQVIDLAIILPAIFISGVFLLKKMPFGFILTPIILTFFVLMDISIGMLSVVMNQKGLDSDIMLTAIMGILALISLVLLILYFRSYKAVINQIGL
jgi:hypothetical protein